MEKFSEYSTKNIKKKKEEKKNWGQRVFYNPSFFPYFENDFWKNKERERQREAEREREKRNWEFEVAHTQWRLVVGGNQKYFKKKYILLSKAIFPTHFFFFWWVTANLIIAIIYETLLVVIKRKKETNINGQTQSVYSFCGKKAIKINKKKNQIYMYIFKTLHVKLYKK